MNKYYRHVHKQYVNLWFGKTQTIYFKHIKKCFLILYLYFAFEAVRNIRAFRYDNDNDNDNDNISFDHNIQIEIIMYNSLENQIINWSGDYY